jgi:hypothetical protein
VANSPTQPRLVLQSDEWLDAVGYQLRDARIEELGDWRDETRTRIRKLIKQADPEVIEEGSEGLFNSSLDGNTRRAIDSMRVTRSMKRRSRRSFAPPWQ